MHLEPVPTAPLARRRAVVTARIDRIEYDLARVTQGEFPLAVRELLADLEQELAEIDDACRDEDERGHVILRQHATLRRDLESIAGLLATRRFGEVEQRAAAVLLCDLRCELEAHLVFEERSLSLAVGHAPHWSRRADRLQEEHGGLRDAIDLLVRTAEAAVADLAAWSGIRHEFGGLYERLLAHEQAETELLQCAYLDDLGGGD